MVHEKPVPSFGDLLFPRIFQAFRMAIQPSKLAIAFGAVITLCLTGWIMDLNPTVITAASYTAPVPSGTATDLSLHTIRNATELDLYVVHGTSSLRNFVESRKALGSRTGVFGALRRFGTGQFHSALYAPHQIVGHLASCLKALEWAFRWHTLYSIVFFTLALILLSVAGGAICRIAAMEFARSEKPGLAQAMRFVLRRLVHLLGGLFGPILLVFLFGAPIMLLGLAANIPVFGELLAGLLLPLAFVAVCGAIITLIGTVAGFGLTVPAVAYEDSDSFDAINHSFSYVYSRPWHLGFYTMVAAGYGALCYLFVRLFGYLLLWVTYRFLQIGFLRQNEKLHAIWPEPTLTDFFGHAGAPPDTWSLWLAFLLVRIWVFGVAALMAAFAISFYFSANTIIYALMRQRVDGTGIEEVYTCPLENSTERFSLEAEPEPGISTPVS
jgi:hypothetical protein